MKRLLFFTLLFWPLVVGASCPDTMVFTALATLNNTANTITYTTTSLASPTANTRLYAMVVNSKASAPNIPTFSGYGLSWTQLSTTNFNTLASPTERLTVFTAVATSPTGTLPAASFSAAQTGCIIRVVQVTHSVYPIQIVTTASNTVANPTITMAALGTGGTNSVLTFWGNSQNVYGGTAKANWVEDYDGGYNSPATGGYLMYRISTIDNVPTNTVTSQSWAGVAIEIPAEPCPGTAGTFTVLDNGYQATLTLDGTSTNGTYNFGLGENNSLTGQETVIVTMNSPGYDDTGATSVVQRVIYGTHAIRKPYPDEAYNDEIQAGSITTIKFALSDYVHTVDTNVIANVQAKVYSGAPLSYTNLTVVNNSTSLYYKPFGNWSWPGRRQITNNTCQLSASIWHYFATNGRPVRLVKFVVSDQHSHSSTNTVFNMTLTKSGDAVPIPEYVGNVDISSMTQGDLLSCNWYAYPWLGDSIGASTDGTWTCYGTQTNLCDRTGGYGNVCAIVDAVNGNNGTGKATVLSSLSTNPLPFQTISAAAVAIKGTNAAIYGHLDVGGGYIFLTNGTHDISSGGAYGTNASCLLTITRHPNCNITNVTIGTGDGAIGFWTHINGVTITNNNTLTYWSSGGSSWIDQCIINASGLAFNYSDNVPWYVTRCNVLLLGQSFRGYSTKNTPVPLLRGNSLNTLLACPAYCSLGNTGSVADITFQDTRSGYEPDCVPSIVAFNALYRNHQASGCVLFSASNIVGSSIVQNLIEETNVSSGPLLSLWADGQTNTAHQVLVWNNTMVGNRINYNYNENQAMCVSRSHWSLVGNLLDDYNIKTDIYPGYGANGIRVGNWNSVYGVLADQNVDGEIPNVSAAGLVPDFGGFNWSTPSPTDYTYFKYVLQAAYTNATPGTGNGNYRLQSQSPVIGLGHRTWMLSFDMEGNNRGLLDPPGAYASASPRKGAGFFAP